MITPGVTFPGSQVSVTAIFTDANGALTDPSTVTMSTYSPDGIRTDYVYATDANVTRSTVGSYAATFTPEIAGRWFVRWLGETATGNMSYEDNFNVHDSPFYQTAFSGDYI